MASCSCNFSSTKQLIKPYSHHERGSRAILEQEHSSNTSCACTNPRSNLPGDKPTSRGMNE